MNKMSFTKDALKLATRINAANAGTGLVGISSIPGAGLGLFATRSYRKGEFVAIYNGESVYQCLYNRSGSDGKYVLEISNEFVIDAAKESSIVTPFDTGRYICGTKNPRFINCAYYMTEYGGKFPVAYVRTTRSIEPGEEFLCDYGPQYHFDRYEEPLKEEWKSRTASSSNHTKKCKSNKSGKFF